MDQLALNRLLDSHEESLKNTSISLRSKVRLDLSKQDITGCSIENRAWLNGVSFNGSDLRRVRIDYCNLGGVSFQDASCEAIYINNTVLDGADFLKASLVQATITGCNQKLIDQTSHISKANFKLANLSRVLIHTCDLEETVFSEAKMGQAHLRKVNFDGSDLRYANMDRAETSQVSIRDADCRGLYARFAGLSHISLDRSDLRGADFSHSEFFGSTSLDKINFTGAKFNRTNLGPFSALLNPATVDSVNDFLDHIGIENKVFFGDNDRLQLTGSKEGGLISPHGDSLHGVIYGSMTSGNMPDQNYDLAQMDIITPDNLGSFSIGNVIYAIHWLQDKSGNDEIS